MLIIRYLSLRLIKIYHNAQINTLTYNFRVLHEFAIASLDNNFTI